MLLTFCFFFLIPSLCYNLLHEAADEGRLVRHKRNIARRDPAFLSLHPALSKAGRVRRAAFPHC
jgi:hypothetical protein